MIPEISVERLKEKIDANEDFTLIDVREETEFEIYSKWQITPLNQLDSFLGDLDKSKEYVVHCKMGGAQQRPLLKCKTLVLPMLVTWLAVFWHGSTRSMHRWIVTKTFY